MRITVTWLVALMIGAMACGVGIGALICGEGESERKTPDEWRGQILGYPANLVVHRLVEQGYVPERPTTAEVSDALRILNGEIPGKYPPFRDKDGEPVRFDKEGKRILR